MADNKTPIRYINGHPVADQEARDQAAQNAERIGKLYEEKADKAYMIALFEQLKALILAGDTSGALAVLDQAILDQAILG